MGLNVERNKLAKIEALEFLRMQVTCHFCFEKVTVLSRYH